MLRFLWAFALFASSPALADTLTLDPAAPSPLDAVRVRFPFAGCTNHDSLRVSQSGNRITVEVDRLFFPDCGLVVDHTEEYTLGRLPSGEYDVQVVVDPLPGTLGPSIVIGPTHFTVAPYAATGTLHPHENYTDMWWDGGSSGTALNVYQSGDSLIAVWATYDASGKPTWFALLTGSWQLDADNVLHYVGTVYRTTGPYFGSPASGTPAVVTPAGAGDFYPLGFPNAAWTWNIDGMGSTQLLQRMRF